MIYHRDKNLSVRFTPQEFEQVSRQAEREGLKVSQWLRRLALIHSTGQRERE
jgi:hypothetical protein